MAQHEVVIEVETSVKDLVDTRGIDTLTYAFLPENPVPQAYKTAFQRAFARWSEVILVDFIEHSTADIQIGFYRTHCGCGTANSPKKCPSLAHADVQRGRICINADRNWVLGREEDAFDLKTVAMHEIGHVLGLPHSKNRRSVMYKGIYRGERRSKLREDDVIQIRKLYPPRTVHPINLIPPPPPADALQVHYKFVFLLCGVVAIILIIIVCQKYKIM